jgi:DNA-binding NarL/FixJ family response regulator
VFPLATVRVERHDEAVKTRVLVVDDHPAFRRAVRRMLEAADMVVVAEVAGAADVVETATAVHPDLVLLDVWLPDGDGFTVAQELAGAGLGSNTVLTSSRSEPHYEAIARDVGAAGFVAKADLTAAALRDLVDAAKATGARDTTGDGP